MGGRGQGPRVSARPRAPSEAKAEIPEIPDHPEIPGAPRHCTSKPPSPRTRLESILLLA